MRTTSCFMAVVALLLLLMPAYPLNAFDNSDAASGTRMTSGNLVMDATVGLPVVGVSGDLVGGFLGFEAKPKYLPGDADASGNVGISDAVWIINFVFGGGVPPKPIQSGDADCSGLIGIGDAVYLINFIFGGGPKPHFCP